ncbi:MAG TPA: D-alanyl-D-alanine carboxypeptidase family protein [Devosia sp.]|nr:D-alanyl-D-alanine carboxypeptidase family protein [Devosia sp.]
MRRARSLLLIACLALSGLSVMAPLPVLARAHTAHARPAKPAHTAPAAPLPDVQLPALLVDMHTGDVLYEANAGKPWHPASLTKLMTAYVTFQAIAQGRVTLDTKVVMSAKAVSQAPASSGLPRGDSLTLRDALYIMLVKSANDMAVAVAEAVDGSTDAFAAEMNATAAKLGLVRTHYDNVNGLPDDGQVTTARDLAVLAIDLRRTFSQYDAIYQTQRVTIGKVVLKASNDMLGKFEGTTGMKTGFICAAGLNIVATVKRGNRELMAVILGGSSARERDQLAAQLLLRGFAGEYQDKNKNVVEIVDDTTSPPMDMKPLLCGAQAKAYVAARLKAFPFGLKGQPSYLTDEVDGPTYAAADFGVPGAAPAIVTPTDEPAEGDTSAQDDSEAPVPAAAPSRPGQPAVVVPQPRLRRK